MKFAVTSLFAALILLLSSCAGHYSASSHYNSRYGYSNHVGVGIHTHGRGSQVLGALAVGGLIGHLLTKSAENKKREVANRTRVYDEQNRFYQLGEDGNCYLMGRDGDQVNIITKVSKSFCR